MKIITISILALSASLCAQSSTLPAGFDGTAGTQRLWAGWDVQDPSQQAGRGICLYDSTTFGWTTNTVVTQLSVRRNAGDPTATTTKHTKTMRLYMSTGGLPPTNADMGSWTRNHGGNVKLIVGTTAAPATINFPATPTSSAAAPFNVVFKLTAPFVMLATAKTAAIEWRSYASAPTTARFRVDATVWTGLTRSNGRFSTINASKDCSGGIKLSSGGAKVWIGGSVRERVTTTAARPNLAFIGLLGTKLPTAALLPGTTCELWTLGDVLITSGQVGPAGAIDFVYAGIPLDPKFVGVKVTHQIAFFDKAFGTLGIGLSVAREITIGAGADTSGRLHGYHVYSYGTNHSGHDNKPMDPDTNAHPPRASQDRAVIWKIN